MPELVSLERSFVTRRKGVTEITGTTDRSARDAETFAWVDALSDAGPQRDQAIDDLHALLLNAARFEIARRHHALGTGQSRDFDDLATQAADDALMAILRKLHTFRGASRFTTWAYKFALLEASVKVRRRAWQDREVPLEAEGWAQLPAAGDSPGDELESLELISVVRDAIVEVLTPHQRVVVVALTLNDVPIDVLAERLATTRGALYKTLHDARRKLRAHLAGQGLEPQPAREGGRL